MTTASQVLRISATPSYMGGGFTLRFPPDLEQDILPLLDDNRITHGTAIEMSAGPADWIEMIPPIALGLGGLGGLHGLAAVIRAIAHRNDNKKVVVKIDEIEVAGFSKEKVIELLQESSVRRAETDAEITSKLGPDTDRGH